MPRSGRRAPVWTPEDTNQLLIGVDEFVRSQRVTRLADHHALVRHLQTVPRLTRFSKSQIEHKLRDICRKWGNGPTKRLNCLLDKGLEGLEYMPTEIRQEVDDARKAREIQSPRHLRSTGLFPDRRQRPKGRARQPSIAPSTPTRIARASRSQSTVPVTPSRGHPNRPPVLAPEDVSASVPTATSVRSRPISPTPSVDSISDTDTNMTLSEPQQSNRSQGAIPDSGRQDQLLRGQHTTPYDSNEPIGEQEQPLESSSGSHETLMIHAYPEVLQDLLKENAYLRAKCEANETEVEIEELATRALKRKSIEPILKQNKELRSRMRLKNKKVFRESGPNLTIPIIRDKFETLKRECGMAAQKPHYQHLNIHSGAESTDIEELISTAVYGVSGTASFRSNLSQLESRLSSSQIVHCLIGMAIQEWVFKPPMPSFLTLKWPLLDQYRSLIRQQCNTKFLRALDCGAHQLLTETPSFKHLCIKGTAERLANRLLDVIVPFWVKSPSCDRSYIRERLRIAFESSLEIKALTLCSKDVFEPIWAGSGSSVSKDVAVTETEHSGQRSDNGQILVNVTLIPGIQKYDWDGETFDYCNFSIEGKEALSGPQTVCRALVVPINEMNV